MNLQPLSEGKSASSSHEDDLPVLMQETALNLTLRPLHELLRREGVTEICINAPGVIHIETDRGWSCERASWAHYEWCRGVAKLVANATHQRIDEQSPLLSASLSSGERIQVVLPPATTQGCVALTLRRPSISTWSIEELKQRGVFAQAQVAAAESDVVEALLRGYLTMGDIPAFLQLAVRERKNILVSGATGAGKTTLTKALILQIPEHERLITIEDAAELSLNQHPNHVRLFFSRGDQGLSHVTAQQLVQASLRMRPDRILLAELRGEEALDYLRQVNSGHPGSITSVHAASAALALEAMVLLVKQSQAGRELSRADIKHLLAQTVDLIVQCGRDASGRRVVTEVWYQPEIKRDALVSIPSA